MTDIINAHDNYTNEKPISIGENGHAQCGWSNQIEDAIVQYHFQIVRGNTENMRMNLIEIIERVQKMDKDSQKRAFILLYKILAQTRDIIDGKGECQLSYMMIYTWWHYFPDLAFFAIRQFTMGDAIVNEEGEEEPAHQYGSWKDIKYLCDYVYNITYNSNHDIIHYCTDLVCYQIEIDNRKMFQREPISLCAKWVPRESSKYKWLFILISRKYCAEYYKTALASKNKDTMKKADLKSRMSMRRILTKMNKYLDTVQIKQCANIWDQIDHNKTTSITLIKQRKALLNQTMRGEQRSCENHRIVCAENFKMYIESKAEKGETIKGKRVAMADFTKEAIKIKSEEHEPDNLFDKTNKDILDSMWRDSSKDTQALENAVVMCDTSGSMYGDPLDVCIAMGIRIAEKSTLGKRVMTFSSTPSWLDISHIDSFVDMVDYIYRDMDSKGLNTDFYKALDLLLNAIVEKKLDAETVRNMSLVILSDMQIDCGDKSWNNESLYDSIERKYCEAGIKAIGEPYKVPLLVFWNLRQTDGFPVLAKQKNTAMMSGFSPALLNDFCEKGVAAFEDYANYTPFRFLVESLSKPRYQCMEDEFVKMLV